MGRYSPDCKLERGGESRSGKHNPLVVGSSPTGPTNIKELEKSSSFLLFYTLYAFKTKDLFFREFDLSPPANVNRIHALSDISYRSGSHKIFHGHSMDTRQYLSIPVNDR